MATGTASPGHPVETAMPTSDLPVLETALTRLREVDRLLADTDAGICLIHLEACISALESRVRTHRNELGLKS